MTNITKVGIGIAVFKHDAVLLGKRKGSHGAGQWAFPGGHLEYGESFEATARRELAEEVGSMTIKDLQVVSVINLVEYMPKHYVDIGMACEWVAGDPVVMEPDKCESWEWIKLGDILVPGFPAFSTVTRIIEAAIFDRGVQIYDAA